MKHEVTQLALWGGKATFDTILPVGQINIPAWSRFEKLASGIFERHYYSNHGVLAQEFEEKLCALFNTDHAVTVTNATTGLSLSCKALGLPTGGKVIVPAFTFPATVQALTWAGLVPVFCEIDPLQHTITAAEVAPLLERHEVCAILGVHLWGNACGMAGIEELAAERGIPCFYDAAHAVGCTHQGKSFGSNGSCEVFSFHATKILSSAEGGAVATNDAVVAERLRNLRSSYGRRATAPIPVNANGRFSEMQAAFGLLSLEDFPANCETNRKKMGLYREGLAPVPGIRLLSPSPGEKHNCQYVVLEIAEDAFGLGRDDLVRVLEAENVHARRYFVPGMHRCVPYCEQFPQFVDALPVTDELCGRVMQLPSGQRVTDEHIGDICELVHFIHEHAAGIKGRL